jgi:hypothetical protein
MASRGSESEVGVGERRLDLVDTFCSLREIRAEV